MRLYVIERLPSLATTTPSHVDFSDVAMAQDDTSQAGLHGRTESLSQTKAHCQRVDSVIGHHVSTLCLAIPHAIIRW